MNFAITEDQRLVRDMVREFCEKELADIAAELDASAQFPKRVLKKMGELGLMGLAIPEKYSGGEMNTLSIVIAIEEIGKVCASTSTLFGIHNLVVSNAIAKFGTNEQKKKFLPRLASGEMIGVMALAEPETISAIELISESTPNGYALNGTKNMLLAGENADIFIVLARDEKNDVKIFLLTKDIAGFVLNDVREMLGLRASRCCSAKFENCALHAENLLGNKDEQTTYINEIQKFHKLAISAVGIGIAQTALKMSIEHSHQRQQFDKYLAEFQGLRWMMAQMKTEIELARNYLYYAASLLDAGKPAHLECAIAKVASAQAVVKATTDAIQIRGGYGYMRDYPLERMFRDAKATEFTGGTIQKQKDIIAEKLLG